MGAASYVTYGKGPNPTIAFDAAVAAARHESGHGGYTGTIGEKGYTGTIGEKGGDGFKKVTEDPLPLAAARTLANTLMQGEEDREGELVYTDKWGPANAIPVAPDSAFRIRTKVVNHNMGADSQWLDGVALARAALRSKTICGVEVLEDRIRTRIRKASGKKRKTTFVVLDRHSDVAAREDTFQLAKKKAVDLCTEHGGGYFVKGEIMDEGKAPLFGCVQEQISRKVKLKVTYVEETRRTPAPIGWLFFGYASE